MSRSLKMGPLLIESPRKQSSVLYFYQRHAKHCNVRHRIMLSEDYCGEGVVTKIIAELKDFAASFSCATYVPLAAHDSLEFIFVTQKKTLLCSP